MYRDDDFQTLVLLTLIFIPFKRLRQIGHESFLQFFRRNHFHMRYPLVNPLLDSCQAVYRESHFNVSIFEFPFFLADMPFSSENKRFAAQIKTQDYFSRFAVNVCTESGGQFIFRSNILWTKCS